MPHERPGRGVGVRPDGIPARRTTLNDNHPDAQDREWHRDRLGTRDLTHASFFSGVGGLDLGLERAGWRTVSFSEIDPYASAVLAERFPGVPNLGDIVALAAEDRAERPRRGSVSSSRTVPQPVGKPRHVQGGDWRAATLWSGGFPCQDLSVAGKRRGMGSHDERSDTRSGLAYAFLDLVERHRPPAILLENVPGLLSSNGGKDLGALLSRLGELGYWWAYRILDAQFFGVPQRRRRVFICALHAGAGFGADSAAAVLSVGARCDGHSTAGDEAGEGVATSALESSNRPGWGRINHALGAPSSTGRLDPNGESFVISPSPDSGGDGAPHGMARRLDDSQGLEGSEVDAANEAVRPPAVRDVRDSDQSQAVQRAAGGLRGIPASEALRSPLRRGEGAQAGPELDDGPLPRQANGSEGSLPAMRDPGRAGRASHRRELPEQRPGESNPALPILPHEVPRLAPTLRVGPARPQDGGPGDTVPIIVNSLDQRRGGADDNEAQAGHLVHTTGQGWWTEGFGTIRADAGGMEQSGHLYLGQPAGPDYELLPLGLDSHRYRCCGNGVVSNVSEWIGHRLARAVA